MIAYRLKVRLLRTPRGSLLWRRARAEVRRRLGRGARVGSYADLPALIREHAPGKGFVDVGCMWGVDGEYAFLAEDAGAREVKGVDVFGPTPAFEAEHRERGSAVEFVLGDAGDPATIARVGPMDVVFCAGVLYHHPAPYDLLVALRRMCTETLILRTSTIPEVPGLRNAAVLWPGLPARDRARWELSALGVGHQPGISGPFDPEAGYGNWFWGLTPSCLESLLGLAGFEVLRRDTEAFAQTVVCRAVDPPFHHELPSASQARALAAEVADADHFRPQ